MQYFKKSLALLLAVLMLLSTLTLVSFAAEGDTTETPAAGDIQTPDPGIHNHQYNTAPDIAAVAPT